MPDSDMTLPTWPDIGRHRERKMSATKLEVEITQELFPLPVFVAAILDSGCRPTSDNVGAGMSESGIVENMGGGVAVEILCVAVIQAEITRIYADFQAFSGFPAAILDSWKVSNMV